MTKDIKSLQLIRYCYCMLLSSFQYCQPVSFCNSPVRYICVVSSQDCPSSPPAPHCSVTPDHDHCSRCFCCPGTDCHSATNYQDQQYFHYFIQSPLDQSFHFHWQHSYLSHRTVYIVVRQRNCGDVWSIVTTPWPALATRERLLLWTLGGSVEAGDGRMVCRLHNNIITHQLHTDVTCNYED